MRESMHMGSAYVVGQIKIRNAVLWDEYRNQVPETLAPWDGEVILRGKQVAALAGQSSYTDIVAIRFPSMDAANSWFSSAAYQALIALREEAAEVVLISYRA